MTLENVAEIKVRVENEPAPLNVSIRESGPPGPQGEPGYNPVKGVDYWTEEDRSEIKSYCDSLILDVLERSY